jgi:hypothetical protein
MDLEMIGNDWQLDYVISKSKRFLQEKRKLDNLTLKSRDFHPICLDD